MDHGGRGTREPQESNREPGQRKSDLPDNRPKARWVTAASEPTAGEHAARSARSADHDRLALYGRTDAAVVTGDSRPVEAAAVAVVVTGARGFIGGRGGIGQWHRYGPYNGPSPWTPYAPRVLRHLAAAQALLAQRTMTIAPDSGTILIANLFFLPMGCRAVWSRSDSESGRRRKCTPFESFLFGHLIYACSLEAVSGRCATCSWSAPSRP